MFRAETVTQADSIAPRYTREQILCGIRQAWRDALGESARFGARTNIYQQLQTVAGWKELDLLDVFMAMERTLGFRCTEEEWREFCDQHFRDVALGDVRNRECCVAPDFTFGALADFIRDRLVALPLEPMVVLGKPCRAAGAFRAIRALVRRVRTNAPHFGPSTPIWDCLRGRALWQAWEHLRWISLNRLPPLRATWLDRFISSGWTLLGVLLLSVGFSTWVGIGRTEGLLVGLLVAAVPFAVLVGLGRCVRAVLRRTLNPLPQETSTFRDLALIVANEQPGMGTLCYECGYNLFGVSQRCPECGTCVD